MEQIAPQPESRVYAEQASEAEKEIDILTLIGVLFRYRKFIIVFTILFSLLLFGFVLATKFLPLEQNPFPDYFEPAATLFVETSNPLTGVQSSGTADAGSVGLGGLLGLGRAGPGKTAYITALFTLDSVADRLIEEMELAKVYQVVSDTPEFTLRNLVQKKISAVYDVENNFLRVSYRDTNPELSAGIVNHLVKTVNQYFNRIEENQDNFEIDLVEERIGQTALLIADLEDRFKQYFRDYGTNDIARLASEISNRIVGLKADLAAKEAEIAAYRRQSRVVDPIMRRLLSEKEGLNESLRLIESGGVNHEFPSQQELPELLSRFQKESAELQTQRQIYKNLVVKHESIRLALGQTTSVYQVVEEARTPERKAGPPRALICMAGAFLIFIVSLILVFIRNAWRSIKNNPVNYRKITGRS